MPQTGNLDLWNYTNLRPPELHRDVPLLQPVDSNHSVPVQSPTAGLKRHPSSLASTLAFTQRPIWHGNGEELYCPITGIQSKVSGCAG